jgi:DNA-binding MarR family transcriptional regulator
MAEDRWLDDEEQEAWRAFLWMSQLLREALDRQLQRDAGIPHAYYLILAMLSEAPCRSMTMTQLAHIVRSSPSRLSHAVARLEEEGWVRRVPHPTDGRTKVAELTDEGLAKVVRTAPGHADQVRRSLFDQLTREQVRALRAISEAALAELDPSWGSAAREEAG